MDKRFLLFGCILETAELLSVDGFRESISKADNDIKTIELFSIEEAFK